MHTHDLSLPLCLSKSRFPRESKPSPRPMPRPLPPRPPRPPPRPLGGLSPEGLLDRNKCNLKHVKKGALTQHTSFQCSCACTSRRVLKSSPSLIPAAHFSAENSLLPSGLSSAGFSKRRSRGGLRSGLLSPGRPSACAPWCWEPDWPCWSAFLPTRLIPENHRSTS